MHSIETSHVRYSFKVIFKWVLSSILSKLLRIMKKKRLNSHWILLKSSVLYWLNAFANVFSQSKELNCTVTCKIWQKTLGVRVFNMLNDFFPLDEISVLQGVRFNKISCISFYIGTYPSTASLMDIFCHSGRKSTALFLPSFLLMKISYNTWKKRFDLDMQLFNQVIRVRTVRTKIELCIITSMYLSQHYWRKIH